MGFVCGFCFKYYDHKSLQTAECKCVRTNDNWLEQMIYTIQIIKLYSELSKPGVHHINMKPFMSVLRFAVNWEDR